LGSESETCVGNRVHLVGVSISIEKNFYRLPFTPPLSGSPYRSFNPQIQKLLYAVVLARCKLRHYFEAHPVMIVSSFPLGENHS
jgi:hypothetical protein